jgi:hypothetical protein
MPLPYTSADFALHVDRARTQSNTAASQTGPDKAATLAAAQVNATLALAIATWLASPQSRSGEPSSLSTRLTDGLAAGQ